LRKEEIDILATVNEGPSDNPTFCIKCIFFSSDLLSACSDNSTSRSPKIIAKDFPEKH
jgi:hypothetical protein